MADQLQRPQNWGERKNALSHSWQATFLVLEWLCEWAAYWLSQRAFVRLLEYIGKLSLLGAMIAYVWTAGERRQAAEDARKTKHYQAWQSINSAIGKPGDGGRSDALQDLNRDGVPLYAVDVSNAVFDQPLVLTNAKLGKASFANAFLNGPSFAGANLDEARLGNLRCIYGNFSNAHISNATMTNALFYGCDFSSSTIETTALVSNTFVLCNFYNAKLLLPGWSDDENHRPVVADTRFNYCNFAGADVVMNDHLLENLDGCFRKCNVFHSLSPHNNYFSYWATNFGGAISVPLSKQTEWLGWLDVHSNLTFVPSEDRSRLGLPSSRR